MELPLYFISDLHLALNPDKKEIKRQNRLFVFFKHIEKTKGTLFILGDLFDFYFEYNDVIPKDYFSFYNKIEKLKESGVKVHFLLGNHDYWISNFITDTLFDKVYMDDFEFTINNKTFFLTHGDGLLSWDKGYRFLKYIIRSSTFIWLYKWIHPNLGYWIAKKISVNRSNYLHYKDYDKKVVDELSVFAKEKIDSGINYILCGHYHQFINKKIGNGRLLILGDWFSFDSYGIFDGDSLKLKSWENS